MKRILFPPFFVLFVFLSISVFAQNNALEFDGTDDYVFTNLSSSATTVISIEFWVYFNNVNNQQNLVHINDGNDIRRIVPYKDASNQICLFASDASGNAESLASNFYVQANEWYHLAFVYDNRDIFIFVNGHLENSGTLSCSYGMDGSDKLYLAADYGVGFISKIKMDEFRLWNDARSETEIRQNMYRELPNPSSETNLVAYYKLNETSGTTTNDSKGSNNGTLTNYGGQSGYWQTSPAMFGPKNCLDFDGSNDYVLFNNPSAFVGLTELTVEALVYPTSSSGWHEIYQLYPNNITLALSGLGLYAFINDNALGSANSIIISNAVNLNEWNHVALTWKQSTSTLTVYSNGVELGSINNASNEALVAGSSGPYIGALVAGNELFKGKIDEVRVWNNVRTLDELRSNMFKSISGNENGLVSYYNFDNSSGLTVQDFSGSGIDGATQNMDNSDWVTSTAFNNWLNTNSSNPATANNWSQGSGPTSSDNVGIYNYSGENPVVSTTFDCNHFFLETGASISLNDGASFIAKGNEFINGTFTLNKTLTNDEKWHLISVPNNNTTANDFFGDYLQKWNETTGLWEDISDENTLLTPVKAYGFYGTHAKANYAFSGAPNTGDKSILMTVGGSGGNYNKANAVGNPYPSAIDWDLVSGYGAKYTWNGLAYESYPEDSEDVYGTGPQYVAPLQGFFVIPDEAGSFTLTNEDRTHSGADGFEKSSKELKNGLVVFADNGDYQDKLVIGFNEESSDYFEQERDAWKILSNTEGLSQIYTFENDQKLSIDNRPECQSIQLGFKNDANGNYSIGVFEMDGIAKAELEDTKLNQFHNLTKGAYTFNWQTIDSEERFILHLKATGVENIDAQEVQVYAANGLVYLRLDQPEDYEQLQCIDLSGRLIAEYPLQQQNLQNFDMSHLRGVYLVQLLSSKKTIAKKIVLK